MKKESRGLKGVAARQSVADRKTEDDASAALLKCPSELGPVAREEWDRIVGELTRRGILGEFDRGPLAIYCHAYELFLEAVTALNEHGMMIKSKSGYPTQSPYLSIANKQSEIMLRVASEFGFTPASRARSFSYHQRASMVLEHVEPDFDAGLKPLSF